MSKGYEQYKELIEDRTRVWQYRLDLAHHDIRTLWAQSHNTEDADRIADTDALWQYRKAEITWYLPVVVTMDDEHIVKSVIHELVHVAIAPMEDVVKNGKDDQCELAVENIERAIWRAYQ